MATLLLTDGRYLHTAYAVSNIAEELTQDDWSLNDQTGMNFIGRYIDTSAVDSNDPTMYVWEEFVDEDVDDYDDEGDLPVADYQSQLDALQDQIEVLQTDASTLQSNITVQDINVSNASELAQSANDIANATNQHFWTDTNGVHVSDEEGNPEGNRNTVFNSLGMIFRKGANYLTAILAGGASGTDPKGLAIYDGTGNNASNVVASFTDSGVVIGKNASDESRTEISTSGLHIIQNDNGNDKPIADLGYGEGVDAYGNPFVAPFYTLGERSYNSPVGNYSVAEGLGNEASGYCSHVEGEGNSIAEGRVSHAEGASLATGYRSHAENSSQADGEDSHSENGGWAVGQESHAEGTGKTEGVRSHAEGTGTIAQGAYSHSEGTGTQANGQASHAEGCDTMAEGYYSHTSGLGTEAYGRSQTVIGEYNDADYPPLGDFTKRSTYVLMVGNGSPGSGNESNALTVAWNGDVETSGGVTAVDDITTQGDVSTVNVSASGNIVASGNISASNLTGTHTADYTVTGTLGSLVILTGNEIVNVSSANTSTDVYVSYGVTFKHNPNVQLTMLNIGGSYYQKISCAGPSTTGFTIRVRAGNAPGNVNVNWLAIGVLA